MSLFVTFVAVALLAGLLLETSGLFKRQELHSINRRFEARQLLQWSAESLRRLNLPLLWEYHERHEIPRTWYHWDWTLSWLIENNHPPVVNNIVIFNRTPEDEPPDEVVKEFSWMKPLQQYPLPRKTVAEMVDFLAKAGAAAIVLDNDFPQHNAGDEDIAKVVHKWVTTGVDGRHVPVYMVGTVNTGSDSHKVELGVPTVPRGALSELSKLDKTADVESKYLGTTCVFQDEDQVVRGIWLKMHVAGREYESIVLKLLKSLGRTIPNNLPEGETDIDFGCPPKSDIYPIRSLSYLLDPERQKILLNPAGTGDVNVKGAIVFIGDGITDVYSTPFTNELNNQMSGTEILAHALETISRRSWPVRMIPECGFFPDVTAYLACLAASLCYQAFLYVICGLVWISWKTFQLRGASRRSGGMSSVIRLLQDLCVCMSMLAVVNLVPCLIFTWFHILVPMFVPTVALVFATLATIVLEREREREEKFQFELQAAEEKLALTQAKYDAEFKHLEAEGRTREMLIDRKRRHEFVRRINHDLNAPVSVLNWTVAELQMMELGSEKAMEKVARLVKSSDKLCELIDQLVQSYDYETVPNEGNSARTLCDLTKVVHESVDGQLPLATMNSDVLNWTKPEKTMWVKANQLELTRVVDNLIRNAVKHNPQGTKVSVQVQSKGAFYVVSITDNGKGIAAEHLDKIFKPGFRVEPSNKDGQGLGLDIAKTLIEGMGGEITVTSTLRKGTTFELKIPICSEEEVAVAQEHQKLESDSDSNFEAEGDFESNGDFESDSDFADATQESKRDDESARFHETGKNGHTIYDQNHEHESSGDGPNGSNGNGSKKHEELQTTQSTDKTDKTTKQVTEETETEMVKR